jgi:hypothetical protein
LGIYNTLLAERTEMNPRFILIVAFPLFHKNTEMIIALKNLFDNKNIRINQPRSASMELVQCDSGDLINSDMRCLEVNFKLDPSKETLTKVKKFLTEQTKANTNNDPFQVDLYIVELHDNVVVDTWSVKEALLVWYEHTASQTLDEYNTDNEYINKAMFVSEESRVDRSLSDMEHCSNLCKSLLTTSLNLKDEFIFFVNKEIPPEEVTQEITIDSINAAMQKADDEVTDPVQKSFLQRLREMVGI